MFKFSSFEDFYSNIYLKAHQNKTNRRLHLIGTTLGCLQFVRVLLTRHWLGLVWVPVIGYGFAWTGHFFFENNIPLTYYHPYYSFLADFRMYKDMISGKLEL